ncbi:MAG: acylphosphatase [Haemophilus parainfluenzae]|nr:acylphosphatase [Haemophilus parainfluenzae]
MAKRFVVYGRVQGVGFRYFTWKEAEKIGIKGTVRNCTDGSVEIDQLQYFYDWLKVGPRTATVEQVLVDNIEDKRYSDFSIIHR